VSLRAVLCRGVGCIGMDDIGLVRMGSVTLEGFCADYVFFLSVWSFLD